MYFTKSLNRQNSCETTDWCYLTAYKLSTKHDTATEHQVKKW